MSEEPLRILQVSTVDINGGAARVAWNLFRAHREAGCRSWLAVGRKQSTDRDVFVIPNDASRSWWARLWISAGRPLWAYQGKLPGAGALRRFLASIGEPGRGQEQWRGLEDLSFPGTWRLLQTTPEAPQIVHCHNLHGGYFDLRALPWLSQQLPVVLTLHDTWALSGHCAYYMDCPRWKTGCGHCPDLTIYPALRRDATAYNWRRKREIYAESRLYVATPSRWLMQKVEQSMLAAAALETRVIPYGVDLAVFRRAADREAVRSTLGIRPGARVLLFAGAVIRHSAFKDYETLRAAVPRAAEGMPGQEVLFVALGEDGPRERIGRAEVRFVPQQKDPRVVARYYQAADLYLHAARADNFPNTVLEALACGTPVVATAVGGIPEQVKGLQVGGRDELNKYGAKQASGILVPPGDPDRLAAGIVALLTDDPLRLQLGENAAQDARQRFDLKLQVEAYTGWYEAITQQWRAERSALQPAHKEGRSGALSRVG